MNRDGRQLLKQSSEERLAAPARWSCRQRRRRRHRHRRRRPHRPLAVVFIAGQIPKERAVVSPRVRLGLEHALPAAAQRAVEARVHGGGEPRLRQGEGERSKAGREQCDGRRGRQRRGGSF